MFTGIVTAIGTIESSETRGDLRLRIACDFPKLIVGESIAVNGVCLTVAEKFPLPLREGVRGWGESSIDNEMPPTQPSPSRGEGFTATLSAETLARTAPRWGEGMKVNLERALKMGDSISGHMVTGHVDGLAKIIEITPSLTLPPQGGGGNNGSHILALDAPTPLSRFIAEKGSVTLDGVSLTVNRVEGARFWVNIIPHTWAATTFHARKIGDALNLEVDMIARYIERLLQK